MTLLCGNICLALFISSGCVTQGFQQSALKVFFVVVVPDSPQGCFASWVEIVITVYSKQQKVIPCCKEYESDFGYVVISLIFLYICCMKDLYNKFC